MDRLPDVTMIELPHNFRAMVLAESQDIRMAPLEVQPMILDDRMKHMCIFMAWNAVKIGTPNAPAETRRMSRLQPDVGTTKKTRRMR